MEKYQIIPRMFRPKSFSEVVGHAPIVETLKNAIRQNRVGQAYLFCGSRGCGKTTLARLYAKALNCKNVQDGEPCNTCQNCLEIAEGRSLDIIEIDGASNRGIDDIRQINETVGYAPSMGKYKIYIIDEVHMLTKEAFNALLKTLEEPPKNVKFFFATTESHKVPQTIISRCQRFHLGRIPEEALIEKLNRICQTLGVKVEQAALSLLSKLAEGSLRDAESLLDQLIAFGKTPLTLPLTREIFGLISDELLTKLDEAIQSSDLEKGQAIAQELYSSGKDLSACLETLFEHFSSHLTTQKLYTQDQSLYILDTLLDWQRQMHKTPFKKVHLEMLIIHLVRSKERIPLDQLVRRLLELEGRIQSYPNAEAEEVPFTTTPIAPEPIEETPKTSSSTEPNPFEETPAASPATLSRPKLKEQIPSTLAAQEAIKKETEAHVSKYDTLIRFAAVELEGLIKHTGR